MDFIAVCEYQLPPVSIVVDFLDQWPEAAAAFAATAAKPRVLLHWLATLTGGCSLPAPLAMISMAVSAHACWCIRLLRLTRVQPPPVAAPAAKHLAALLGPRPGTRAHTPMLGAFAALQASDWSLQGKRPSR